MLGALIAGLVRHASREHGPRSFGVVMALRRVHAPLNIQRMWIGSENRARRLWLLRPRERNDRTAARALADGGQHSGEESRRGSASRARPSGMRSALRAKGIEIISIDRRGIACPSASSCSTSGDGVRRRKAPPRSTTSRSRSSSSRRRTHGCSTSCRRARRACCLLSCRRTRTSRRQWIAPFGSG
jgi:hypothetical protein